MIQLQPGARYDTGAMTTFDRAPLVDTFGEMARRYAQQRKELEDQHTDALGGILAKNQRALSPQEVAKRKMRIDELNGQLVSLIQDEANSKEDPNGELQLGITDHSAEKKQIQDEINELENFEGNIQNENEASRLEYDSDYARDKMRYAPKTTRNLDAISQSIGNGLQAVRNGQAILQQAKTAEKTLLPQLKADYDAQYNAWQESLVNASEADATSRQLQSVGKLPAFEEFLRGGEKQDLSWNQAKLVYDTAKLNNSIAKQNLEQKPLETQKLKAETQNAQIEGVKKNEEVKKVKSENKNGNIEQAKLGGFGDLMEEAEKTLSKGAPSFSESLSSSARKIPFIGEMVKSSPFDIAMRTFINSKLRQESGAAIGADEYEGARKQYIPSAGDSPQILAMKKKQRDLMIANMKRAQGVSGDKPQSNTNSGKIVNTGRVKM